MAPPGSGAPREAPLPRSPPTISVLSRRHRLPAEVEIANREIKLLQEELQSLDGLQSASLCCKEVNEFVETNPDPLLPVSKDEHQSTSTWKWLRAKLCFSCNCCSCPRRRARNGCCNCKEVLYCRPSTCLYCSGCSCGCGGAACPDCRNVLLCFRCAKSCRKQCLC